MPHRCLIQRVKRTKGSLVGSKETPVVEQTDVECWSQNASHAEINDYMKRGMVINRKVYFPTDPGVTSRHQILVTEMRGVVVANPIVLDVNSEALPDASAGMGIVFKVMAEQVTSREN